MWRQLGQSPKTRARLGLEQTLRLLVYFSSRSRPDTEEGETSDTAREASLEMLATHPRLVPSLLA
eukprot:COSAG04_NODE_16950_length_484_cov_0.802597_2_plen_64_part_01